MYINRRLLLIFGVTLVACAETSVDRGLEDEMNTNVTPTRGARGGDLTSEEPTDSGAPRFTITSDRSVQPSMSADALVGDAIEGDTEELEPMSVCGASGCQWSVSAWSECPSQCGEARLTRAVTCLSERGEEVDESLCVASRPEGTMMMDCTLEDARRECVGDATWIVNGCGERVRERIDCAQQGGCLDGMCQCDASRGDHVCCYSSGEYDRFRGCMSVMAVLFREGQCPSGIDDPEWRANACND